MSKEITSIAFNAIVAIVLLGATLAYVAPPPDELGSSPAASVGQLHWVPQCWEVIGADCDDAEPQEARDREDDVERDDDDDDDRHDNSGKGNRDDRD
jgi:hypothetical protein